MKIFKSVKWDVDAENDTFQELFQKPSKSKVIKNKKKKAKKLEMIVNKSKKNVQLSKITNTINLVKTPIANEKLSKRQKKKLKKLNKEHKNINNQNDNTNNHLKKIKNKLKNTQSNDTPNLIDSDKRKSKTKKKFKIKEKIDSSDLLEVIQNKKKRKITKESLINEPPKGFKDEFLTENLLKQPNASSRIGKKEKFYIKLKNALHTTKEQKPVQTLRQKMMEKLKAARFRFINEQIYTADSKEAQKIFLNDPDSFNAYHDGYRKQVKSWPVNPLDVIIESIKKMPKTQIIADFGCGEARLSKFVTQKVHSFDLVAANDEVIACDMSKVPLENNSVNVTVFCLSLMGTNLRDYLFEANRVLKIGGIMKIAEVESRFQNIEEFIKGVQYFGFKNTWKDLSHNLFYFLDFRKEKEVKNKNKLPTMSLLPCLYKKR